MQHTCFFTLPFVLQLKTVLQVSNLCKKLLLTLAQFLQLSFLIRDFRLQGALLDELGKC